MVATAHENAPAFDNARYWNELADEYQRTIRIATDDFHYGPLLPGDRELGLLPDKPANLNCLEIACGAGQNSIYLASRQARCTGLDISTRQLDHGRYLADHAGVHVDFRQMSMDELLLQDLERYDLIHSSYGIPFSANPGELMSQCAHLLNPGGWLIFSVGHPLFAGQWIELDEEGKGLFLPDYFQPAPEMRLTNDGRTAIKADYHPVSRWVSWIRAADLDLDSLLEPEPLPVPEMDEDEIRCRIPYDSEAWRELYDQLSRIPFLLIFRCRKSFAKTAMSSPKIGT